MVCTIWADVPAQYSFGQYLRFIYHPDDSSEKRREYINRSINLHKNVSLECTEKSLYFVHIQTPYFSKETCHDGLCNQGNTYKKKGKCVK